VVGKSALCTRGNWADTDRGKEDLGAGVVYTLLLLLLCEVLEEDDEVGDGSLVVPSLAGSLVVPSLAGSLVKM
jgi:hypothetical protein